MRRAAFLLTGLPLLISCGRWEEQWKARDLCEKGRTLIVNAESAMLKPSLTTQEQAQIRSDLFEGIFQIRSAQAMSPPRCFFYKPEKYQAEQTRAAFLMIDPRVNPKTPASEPP